MKKREKVNWKYVLGEIFGELFVYLIIFFLGLFGLWLLPFDLPNDLDFELLLCIGVIISLPIVLFIGFIVYFIKIGHKNKD